MVAEVVLPQVDPLLDKIEVINERENGLIEAMVPADLIYTEDVPVDASHVEELARSFVKESARVSGRGGQLSPVLLGEVPGLDQLLIIDGFHRTEVVKRDGGEVYSTIRRNSTVDEITDLRILTAVSHRSVRFSRVIGWVTEAWERSPWGDKITALQAFTLAMSKGSGKILGLTPDEAEEVQEWALNKCEQWAYSPASVHKTLHTASIASPDLIREARERKQGRELLALTPHHLTVIANAFPSNFEMQHLVADITKQHGLTVPLTRTLAKKFANVESPEEAVPILENPKLIESLIPSYSPKTEAGDRRRYTTSIRPQLDTEHNYKELLGYFIIDEIEIARLSLENLILRGKYVAGRLDASERRAGEIVFKDNPYSGQTAWEEEHVEWAIARMENMSMPRVLEKLPGAKKIFNNSTRRVLDDIRNGGLRFIKIDDARMIDNLVYACVLDEINSEQSPLMIAKPEGAPFVQREDEALKPGSPTRLAEMLPKLDPNQRRIFILWGIFGLSSFAISQIVKFKEERVDAIIASAETITASD